MAAYPNYPQLRTTRFEPNGGIQTDFTDGGTIRIRHIWDSPVYAGVIVHALYTEADVAALEQFYQDNKTLPFTFTYASDPPTAAITYTCYFTDSITIRWTGRSFWQAEVPITGKRD